MALLVRRMFDHDVPARDTGAVIEAGVVMALLGVASAAVGFAARRFAAVAGRQGIARLRHDLLLRLYALPIAWHDRRDPGELHAALVQDTERLSFLFTQVATSIAPAAI